MSLEIILAVAFGRDIRVQKGDGDQLFKEAKKLMELLTRTPGGHVTALLSIGGPISFTPIFYLSCIVSEVASLFESYNTLPLLHEVHV